MVEFFQIPLYDQYEINRTGEVRSRAEKIVVPPVLHTDKRWRVRLLVGNRSNRYTKPQVARLLLMTFKQGPISKYAVWSPKFHDGNTDNVTLDNLSVDHGEYEPPEIVQGSRAEKRFYPHPTIPNMMVNCFGRIKYFGKDVTTYSGKNVYLTFVIVHEGRRFVKAVHRVVAEVFLKHPHDVVDLEVNHEDGDRSNNYYRNLSWVTYSGNIKHAYENGQRRDNKPIVVMDITTGEISEYASLSSFCHDRGLTQHESTAWFRLRNHVKLYEFYGYLIKYKTDDRKFPEIADIPKSPWMRGS